jgi:hypothetical protein
MKAILVILIVLLFVGCNPQQGSSGSTSSSSTANQSISDKSKLTADRAQRTVNLFVQHHEGSIQVRGVREIPSENSAIADLDISGVMVPSAWGPPHPYNGPGVATFSHYTDGRWVLTKIQVSNEYHWWTLEASVD